MLTITNGGYMKNILAIIILATMTYGVAQAADTPTKQRDTGFYFQRFDGIGSYLVDTIAQTCLFRVAESGLTTISCSDLAKRSEWKPIITWVK
jgi:hypothetical protein